MKIDNSLLPRVMDLTLSRRLYLYRNSGKSSLLGPEGEKAQKLLIQVLAAETRRETSFATPMPIHLLQQAKECQFHVMFSSASHVE